VNLVGKLNPEQYSFRSNEYWPDQNKKPADFRLKRKKKD